ncbi:hypothetical protein ACFX1T_023095 [Malus domestica]
MCRVWWLPEGLSDPINCVSRSALARVLFLYLWARLYPDLWISPASKRDPIKICHLLGDAFFSMSTPPLNDELCQSSPPTRPGENTGSSQALTRLNLINISFVWSRREKARGTGLLLFYYITEKSILVMIDPRPIVVSGNLACLALLTRRNFSLIARASQSIQPFSCLVR